MNALRNVEGFAWHTARYGRARGGFSRTSRAACGCARVRTSPARADCPASRGGKVWRGRGYREDHRDRTSCLPAPMHRSVRASKKTEENVRVVREAGTRGQGTVGEDTKKGGRQKKSRRTAWVAQDDAQPGYALAQRFTLPSFVLSKSRSACPPTHFDMSKSRSGAPPRRFDRQKSVHHPSRVSFCHVKTLHGLLGLRFCSPETTCLVSLG